MPLQLSAQQLRRKARSAAGSLLRVAVAAFVAAYHVFAAGRESAIPQPTRTGLLRIVDLNIHERREIRLAEGTAAAIQILDLCENRDEIRNAVRQARVLVGINGNKITLTSGTYHLPVTVGGVQVDCPVTRGYVENSKGNPWALDKDVRLRLWPADSPWIEPDTFVYPVRQRWFASDTQMANDPVYVDGGEIPANKTIYYHYGLDFGAAEGLIDVVAATDGLVVSAGKERLPGYRTAPVAPRYDVVYVLDDRGWFYRYSHLQSIDEDIRPGQTVRKAQRIGVVGKEGASGGWSHLHFDIKSLQPSGRYGIQAAYPFAWQAYQQQYAPDLIAVARPHHLARTGKAVVLDATRSWARSGKITEFAWALSDGTHASGPMHELRYDKPGTYSEILKISDDRGNTDYDFAVVQVIDRENPTPRPPTIHAVYAPTFDIRPGDPVTFKVRTFRSAGKASWDFGDGTPAVTVACIGNARPHAKDGYAETVHRFARPGQYIVSVKHTGAKDQPATARLCVRVEK